MSSIILLFPLMPLVSAYPINVLNSSSSAASFAALLAVALSVTILVIAKLLYMRYRRLHVSYNISDCSLQSSHRSATSFFYSSEKLAKPGKAAFFVGLFGSPSWETSVKTLYDGPSIYSNQLQFQSRRSQNRTSRFSISEFGGLGRSTRHYSTNSDSYPSRAFSNTLVATSRPPPSYASLPSYPADARTNSSSRRHSLPVTRQVNSEDRRKRHSSLKSSKSRRSDSLSTPGLRMIDSTRDTDTPLPFSPKSHTSFLDFERSSPYPSSTHFRTISKSNRSGIPPLPPLPASVVLSPLPGLPGLAPAEGRSYISFPYALSPKIKLPSSDTDTDSDPQDQAFDMVSDTASRRFSQTSVSRIKPKPTRSPSVRSRKSPVIGPSPLRIVTLPELSQANLNKLAQKEIFSTIPTEASDKKQQNYADLGIGYPSCWGMGLEGGSGISQIESETERSRFAHRRASQTPSSAPSSGFMSQHIVTGSGFESSPRPSEVDDADAMLGIIQELVEETSQWDDSLFMDDSFKALIQHSRSAESGSGSALAQSSSSKSSHHSRHSSVLVDEEIPAIPTPPRGSSAESGRPARPQSVSSNASARSNVVSEAASAHSGERKVSPKSILKKTTMVASRSMEVDLGLLELDAVRMESFRMSAYDDPMLYDAVIPGAYEHGMLLAPLLETNEELEEEQQVQAQLQVAQQEVDVGLAW